MLANLCFLGAIFWIRTPPIFEWKTRKFSKFFSNEVSNFLKNSFESFQLMSLFYWIHTIFYPSPRFFANKSIYKKATRFIPFRAKSSRFSGCMYQISCVFMPFKGYFQGLNLGLTNAVLLNVVHFSFFH